MEYIRVIKDSKPKVFIFENVKGILSYMIIKNEDSKEKIKLFDWLIEQFKNLEYNLQYKVISGLDVGINQSRQRIFLVGQLKTNKDIKDNIFDDISKKKIKSDKKIKDYLDNEIDEKYIISNHKWQKWIFDSKHIDKQKMRILSKNRKDYIICQTARQYRSWFGNFVIEKYKCKDFTYSDDAKKYIKNNEIIPLGFKKFNYKKIIKESIIRKLTPDECLRFMGFDTSVFNNKCSNAQIYKQCGNSIIVNCFDYIFDKLYYVD